MKPLVVISFYDRRPVEPLIHLLDSLDAHDAGATYERVICVNTSGGPTLPPTVTDRVDGMLARANHGMNIGAWDAGWRHWPGRPSYLFLQDECYAVRPDWIREAVAAVDDLRVGLAGESLNDGWDRPWEELRTGAGCDVLPEHFVNGAPANRVDVYLHHLRRFGIDPGPRGRHLRSLTWVIRGDVLKLIDGFPVGANYGECIAAEIGVSRAVEAHGLEIRQIGPTPFHVFRHLEWAQDRAGSRYTQKPLMLRELQRLKGEVETLRGRLEHPSFRDLGLGLLRRFRRGVERDK